MKKIEIEDKYKMTLKEFINGDWEYFYENMGSLLNFAVQMGDLNLVKKAIEFGAEINTGYLIPSPLCFVYDIEIAKELINAGAAPNDISGGNNIPVTYMYKHSTLPLTKERRETLEYLISVSDIDLPGGHGYTLLLALIEKKEEDYDLFKLVIENTKDLNKLCADETLLFDAALHIKNEKIFLLLAQSGINLYQRNKSGSDFYDYCSENIQKMLKEKMPEFIERRERENELYKDPLDLGRLF